MMEKAEQVYLAGDPHAMVAQCYQVKESDSSCLQSVMHIIAQKAQAGIILPQSEISRMTAACSR